MVAGSDTETEAAARLVSNARFADRRTWSDRIAGGVVRAGGIGIIASILAIVLFIFVEVWPLMVGAVVEPGPSLAVESAPLALAGDAYRTHVASLDADGWIRVRRLADGVETTAREIAGGGAPVAASADSDGRSLAALTGEGAVAAASLQWEIGFEGRTRVVTPKISEPSVFSVDDVALGAPIAVRDSRDGDARVVAAATDAGEIVVFRRQREVNEFTGEESASVAQSTVAAPADLSLLAIDDEQRSLVGVSAGGLLHRWSALDPAAAPVETVDVDEEITALAFLLGGRSIVVGTDDGGLEVWFETPQESGERRLTRIRRFPPHQAPIELIVPSRRDKGFVAVDRAGVAGIYHSTSERVLWRGSLEQPVTALAMTPKADAIVAGGPRGIEVLAVDNPHPDVSVWSLFAPVWYEGYAEPEYVWQSSSGTDDFEPKYSLTPLLVGTLKGTFYSLLIAIPLGVLGAMYVSQFMHPRLRNVIKPTVEIMAALPSVVLGFLAGLWLAPRVESAFPALLLMFAAYPVVIVATGLLWLQIPLRIRGQLPGGSEAIVFAVALAAAGAACIALNGPFEALAFGGNFQAWLRDFAGVQYDQRNAIIVGLAMGFAVIPIIFAISEDAFSNVPRNLVSGSLALGATRWQTVSRVVLPTASPGIFSAIMVGFGRAVGETMIVLMATGNTPIQDWNPFNGFRTLSANIAVEIPEAPQFSTLYRVLFLAALLLFVLTFLLNTAAEIVRQRLRERYARL